MRSIAQVLGFLALAGCYTSHGDLGAGPSSDASIRVPDATLPGPGSTVPPGPGTMSSDASVPPGPGMSGPGGGPGFPGPGMGGPGMPPPIDGGVEPDPLEVAVDCMVTASYYQPGISPEIHTVVLYEATDGRATVVIDRPGPVALVLNAYEPVQWTVEVGAETMLVVVYYGSYEPGSSVTIDRDVEMEMIDYFGEGAFMYPSEAAEGYMRAVVRDIGIPVTSYIGCYEGGRFEIR